MKFEIEFFSVDEKMPEDIWRTQPWHTEESINVTIDTFLVVFINDDPLDDPEIGMADYTVKDGWLYCNTFEKYSNTNWRIIKWAEIPRLKRKKGNPGEIDVD
jgi:hypothetical protein